MLRHVPPIGEWKTELVKHYQWENLPNQGIGLSEIKIPETDLTEPMLLIDPPEPTQSDPNEPLPNALPAPAPFYIDRSETTVHDYQTLVRHLPPYPDRMNKVMGRPMSLKYDDAVAFAEKLGKRLPTCDEWDAAAEASSGADDQRCRRMDIGLGSVAIQVPRGTGR